MNEQQARASFAKCKAALGALDEQIADLDYQISALAHPDPDAPERIALSDERGRLLGRVAAVNAQLTSDREAIIALLVVDLRKATVDAAQAALDELRTQATAIRARRPAARRRQDAERIAAELDAIAPKLQAASRALTRARESLEAWSTWAHTLAGLQALEIA
jgi:hypothetical protein